MYHLEKYTTAFGWICVGTAILHADIMSDYDYFMKYYPGNNYRIFFLSDGVLDWRLTGF